VTKEEGTQPSRPYGCLALLATAATLNIATRVSLRRNRLLRSLSYQQNKPVTKLNLAAYKNHKLLRDSDSRSLFSYFVSATQRDGMGFTSPKLHSERLNR
ncbi:MAG TPA: hypothetical protein VGE32_02670, partial [Cellvibrio sp.]